MSGGTEDMISRKHAVRAIAAALQLRAHWVVSCSPETVRDVGHALATLDPDSWLALLDNGSDMVYATQNAELVEVTPDLSEVEVVAVMLVLKTVPADRMSQLLQGHRIPEEGEQDLIMLAPADSEFALHWPLMLIDAIEVFDPVYAAAIRATDPAAQS